MAEPATGKCPAKGNKGHGPYEAEVGMGDVDPLVVTCKACGRVLPEDRYSSVIDNIEWL